METLLQDVRYSLRSLRKRPRVAVSQADVKFHVTFNFDFKFKFKLGNSGFRSSEFKYSLVAQCAHRLDLGCPECGHVAGAECDQRERNYRRHDHTRIGARELEEH